MAAKHKVKCPVGMDWMQLAVPKMEKNGKICLYFDGLVQESNRDVTPVRYQWGYEFLVLTHRFYHSCVCIGYS